MLGESHALLEDFAEYKEDIFLLLETDKHFHDLSDLYHKLDKRTRNLEERGQPIEDQAFNTLKAERAHLKDELFGMIKKQHDTPAVKPNAGDD